MTIDADGTADPDEIGLTVSAVAHRMGVAPATLRTWDRRYGLGPSSHKPGAHRRYCAADLARLEHMRKLVIAGVPAADAARAARALDVEVGPLASVTELPVPIGQPIEDTADPDVPSSGRAGGGRVLALPGAAAEVRGLARAAKALDGQASFDIVLASLSGRGVIWTWETVLRPVLEAVGRQWSTSGEGVDVEHVLSNAVQDALVAFVRTAPPPTTTSPVLLTCAPEEQHALPVWAIAAALAERRVAARVLGASLPEAALGDAMRRLGPPAVFVWSQSPSTAAAITWTALPSPRRPAQLVVGGPGWATEAVDLPSSVVVATDLTDAVGRLARAAGE